MKTIVTLFAFVTLMNGGPGINLTRVAPYRCIGLRTSPFSAHIIEDKMTTPRILAEIKLPSPWVNRLQFHFPSNVLRVSTSKPIFAFFVVELYDTMP